MNEFSYSRVSSYNDCPFKYRLQYVDKLKVKFDEDPGNALVQGTAIHEAIETNDFDAACKKYLDSYADPSRNEVIFESFKLRGIMPVAAEECPKGTVYEYELKDPGEFIGYIDCLVKNDDGTYDIYDFKYTNNKESYIDSPQVHLYKYYFEKLTGNTVKNISYVFIPKQKDKYDPNIPMDIQLSKIIDYANDSHVKIETVEYDHDKVLTFLSQIKLVKGSMIFPRKQSWKCKWCPYKKYCESNGVDRSEILEKISHTTIF